MDWHERLVGNHAETVETSSLTIETHESHEPKMGIDQGFQLKTLPTQPPAAAQVWDPRPAAVPWHRAAWHRAVPRAPRAAGPGRGTWDLNMPGLVKIRGNCGVWLH